MKERPIIFSGSMVRAILEGHKTQTRRVIRICDALIDLSNSAASNIRVEGGAIVCDWMGGRYSTLIRCPYGVHGDRLWVRETFASDPDAHPLEAGTLYRATDPGWDEDDSGLRWKPAIFMPRDRSRIDLEVTDVRVQRLQDISEPDAAAEGMHEFVLPTGSVWGYDPRGTPGKCVGGSARNELGKVPITLEAELALGAVSRKRKPKSRTLTNQELRDVAGKIGYELAMLIGAADTEWNRQFEANDRSPAAVVHSHARTELVWVHGRCLYDCLFRNEGYEDDVSIPLLFLTKEQREEWKNAWSPGSVCLVIADAYKRANKKLFHVTLTRLHDIEGLPDYRKVRSELKSAFAGIYMLMDDEKKQMFREGLETYPEVASFVLPRARHSS